MSTSDAPCQLVDEKLPSAPPAGRPRIFELSLETTWLAPSVYATIHATIHATVRLRSLPPPARITQSAGTPHPVQ